MRELAVPERVRPAPAPPPAASDPNDPLREDEIRERGRRRLELAVGELHGRPPLRGAEHDDVAESQFWDPCVRDFVSAQPARARRALTTALARYQTACGPGGAVIVQAARGLDGRGREGRSDIALTGTLSAARIDVSLRVVRCGGAIDDAERVVITTEGARWTSQALAFERDEHGCHAAELPLTRAVTRMAREVSSAADAVITFDGRDPHALIVGEEMKQDLRVLLAALDALDAL